MSDAEARSARYAAAQAELDRKDRARKGWVPTWRAEVYHYGVIATVVDGERKWQTTKILPVTRHIADDLADDNQRLFITENLTSIAYRELTRAIGHQVDIYDVKYEFFLVNDREKPAEERDHAHLWQITLDLP